MENIAYIDEVDDDQMIHYDLIHIDTSAMDNLDDKNKSARTVVNGGDCDITDEERYRIKSNYSIGAILTFDNPGFVSDHIENFQDISNAAPGIVMEQKDVRITLRPLDLLNQAMTLETRHDLPDEHLKGDAYSTNNRESVKKYQPDPDINGGASGISEQASCDEEIKNNMDVAVVSPRQAESDLFIQKDGVTPTKGPTSQSLWKKLKTDLPFRRRYMHTLCVCWGFVVLGWMIGLSGPSFPDLRLIIQKNIDTASWLFTTFSIGYLVGSLVAGILYDRFNKLLLIFVSIVTMAVTTAIIPWCSQFPLMLAVKFIQGLGSGGMDTGGNADVVSIWDEEGRPYMQFVHFCFAFGGILSPLMSEPFFAKKQCVPNDSFNNTDLLVVNTTEAYSQNYLPNTTESYVNYLTNVTYPANTSNCTVVYGETHIQYSFLISAVIVITAAVPFLVMYINTQCHKKPHVVKADKSGFERPDKLPIKLKLILLVLLSSLMLTYCAIEDTYAGFLMTYLIKQLQWEKSEGSVATSLYWAAFSFGRFVGIFLIHKFKPIQLLFTYFIMLICSFIAFYITSILNTPVIWAFIPIAGFSMSIVFPCIFTWTEESILNVTGKISSMFLISASSGLMINPLILGYLIDNFSPLCFVYLLFSESVLCLLLFLTILFLVKKHVEAIAISDGKRNSVPEAVVLKSLQ